MTMTMAGGGLHEMPGHTGGQTRALWLTITLAALMAGWLGWQMAHRGMMARLDQSLILSSHALTVEIERFRYLPAVAGEDARIRAALQAPEDGAAIAAANLYLETLVNTSGATHLYLLDAQGLTIAASNWGLPESFIGEDYSFRPYFRDAMTGGKGAFYAIGVTTKQPGYFLSARVTLPSGRQGVVVVKIDLSPLQETWSRAEQDTAVADPDGVIFLASDPGWLYRPLTPLPAGVMVRLDDQQTYTGIDIAGAAPLMTGDHGYILRGSGGVLASSRTGYGAGWQVVAATPLTPAMGIAALGAALGGLAAAMAAGLAKIRRQRRTLVDLQRHQSAVLERRVAERTAELNREIEARGRTEAELRATQETLIQSEKMAALGRMSTAIVHEISQPLAAMEATLVTAGMLAETPAPQALLRIETARGLVRRMQRTTKRLKSFAQKEGTPTEPVDLLAVIEGAMEVVQPRAKAVGVMPQLVSPLVPGRVQAGRVRLEQVLVNLLINALDAVEGRPGARIDLSLCQSGGEARIIVTDNGPGISPEDLPRVTEPFFTTKAQSEGLGLGLTISSEIIATFGGQLDLVLRDSGGLCAIIRLPRLAEAAA